MSTASFEVFRADTGIWRDAGKIQVLPGASAVGWSGMMGKAVARVEKQLGC